MGSGLIFWFTGNSGAGKTTIAKNVRDRFLVDSSAWEYSKRIIILDGDELRATISTEEGFSKEDRTRHNLRVARLASLLASQNFIVLVSVIAPFAELRAEISSICSPKWVYVRRTLPAVEDRPYEPPSTPDLVVDNDEVSIDEAGLRVVNFILNT